ncbi:MULTISPECIES: DsbC family protein [unclassified Caballeronia]|jgi:protein-disulfide isomerase|uniref:DsbC family protein n=1 Tax=unclassified Caballeronia TaxID=2646786 RepID=UPI00285E7859|nr:MULTISPECIES: DsbC family protein [unclassified Caballeronia]MDR5752871.1 DsbC family protein [Caballeronia sp. LZ024]MDR5841515.1 DsbC family protein [Caballeronia sp. LZ031]
MIGVRNLLAAFVIGSTLVFLSPTATGEEEASATQMQGRRIDFASLPLGDAIKTVQGNGMRKVAVFADPYCPYCRTLERRLSEVPDVTIYTFLFPILTPDSKRMAAVIWCASDREATWHAWMLDGRTPVRRVCPGAPLERNLSLAKGLGVKITPTIIFANGELVTGAIPLDDLKSLLAP